MSKPASKPDKSAAPPKSQTLKDVMAQAADLYGDNVMRSAHTLQTFRHIPTGVFTLDMALFGGVPESLVTMFYGWESSGKSTIAMRTVGSAQNKYPDMQAVYIDVEGTFSNAWAARHGVNLDHLFIVQPETGEQAVDICDAVLRASDTSIVVLDSLPALVPIKEIGNSAEDATVALQARLIGTFIRKANLALLDERKKGHRPALLLINQFRNRITMMGDPRTLPGGNALKFFTAVRVELTNREHLGRDDHDVETVEHNEHTFKIGKNKLGTGIRTGEFQMVRNPSNPLGAGFIDDGKTVLTYAKKFDLFTGGGSTWRLDGVDKKFSRIQETVDWLYANPEQFTALKARLVSIQREHAGLPAEGWY